VILTSALLLFSHTLPHTAEYDTMDLEMLREVVPMLRQQLEKSMLDRNYVQLERDSIQQYFDTTRREVRELELAVSAKDREMELLEDNHRVELRVYQQKVKHLEYEHKNNIKTIVQDGTGLLGVEHNPHFRMPLLSRVLPRQSLPSSPRQ
jgi:hypothetical protein